MFADLCPSFIFSNLVYLSLICQSLELQSKTRATSTHQTNSLSYSLGHTFYYPKSSESCTHPSPLVSSVKGLPANHRRLTSFASTDNHPFSSD